MMLYEKAFLTNSSFLICICLLLRISTIELHLFQFLLYAQNITNKRISGLLLYEL